MIQSEVFFNNFFQDTMGWGENDRGVSFTFGAEVAAKFLHKHDFDLICRAHQVNTHDPRITLGSGSKPGLRKNTLLRSTFALPSLVLESLACEISRDVIWAARITLVGLPVDFWVLF